MSPFTAPSGSRWTRSVALVVAATLAMVAVPITAVEPASAATVNVDIGEPCVVRAAATYSLDSGLQISPSTRSLEVVLPPMLWDIGHPLSWTISGPGGTDSTLDEEVPEGARSFVVPIGADLFDPYQPTSGQFQLTFGGGRGGCRDDYAFDEVAETHFTVDLAIVADGPADVRIELTEDNATSATGGDPYNVTLSYTEADSVTVGDWGDTISLAGPAGFWTRGPEGRWEDPQLDALIFTTLEGASLALSPVVSDDGSVASVTLPKAPPPSPPDSYDFWAESGVQLTLSLSETSAYRSSAIRVHTVLDLPVPSVQGTVPLIDGVAKVGERLVAVPGEWEQYAQLRYQWNRDGVPITDGYEATSDYYDPAQRDVGARLSVTVTGTNGLRLPTALASEPTAVVPPAVPGITTDVFAVAGNKSVTVRWTPPTADGGSPITRYRVRAFTEAGLVKTKKASASATSMVVKGLKNGTTYTFDVSAISAIGIGQPSERSFPVTCSVDDVAPTVTSVRPVRGATGVDLAANVRAVLSEPVFGLEAGSFTLRQASHPIPATVTFDFLYPDAAGSDLTLDPTAELLPDRTYTASLSGLRDRAGNPLAAKSWSFTTGPAPTVISTRPAAGETGVNRSRDITARLSEPVVSLTSANFTLRQGSDTIAGAVTYNPRTHVARFNPTSKLPADRTFVATLSGIKDAAGNRMLTKSWSFTTRPAPEAHAEHSLLLQLLDQRRTP